ncbi:MAG: Rrf2 family transcriptional regulator [Oscillospiraceae bacterium]|nr:Rrf2 family transcriptional regulator [Oscillospiraceae bacterium]
MRLSTRSQYGIHAMLDLALAYGGGPQPLRLIAERQDVPEQYLEQLIAPLRRSGLVKSARGAAGGYELALPPENIQVGEVLRALEGPVRLTDCIGEPDACARAELCPSRVLWERLNHAIQDVLDKTTLAELLSSDVNDRADIGSYNKAAPKEVLV